VTARLPRHRSLAAPARFAARWRELAACRGTDLGVFFPERGESAEAARQVCAEYPVRQACLDYAITNRIVHGVWGGLTERERRAAIALGACHAAGSRPGDLGRGRGRFYDGGTRPVVRPIPHIRDPDRTHRE
jgi:WhiB family transcriptional regulator, redox-sensing transcriptional regulator